MGKLYLLLINLHVYIDALLTSENILGRQSITLYVPIACDTQIFKFSSSVEDR